MVKHFTHQIINVIVLHILEKFYSALKKIKADLAYISGGGLRTNTDEKTYQLLCKRAYAQLLL